MQTYEPNIITIEEDKSLRSVSLSDELTNSRILVLDGPVEKGTIMTLIKTMLVLEHKDPKAEISLLISSPGGDVYSGMALIDTMRSISCPVTTIAMGLVASMASVILANGDKRLAYPHAFILIHQLMSGSGMSQQTDLEIAANHAAELRGVLDGLLAHKTPKSADDFHEMTERDCWCSATRALELGIVDEIVSAGASTWNTEG